MKIDYNKDICGENLHQKAKIEATENMIDYDASDILDFCEIISLSKGLCLMSEFYDVNAACSIKHGDIIAAALSATTADAVKNIMDSNPIDFINSIVILSSELESESVKYLKDIKLIAAPKFTQKAKEYLENHKIKYVQIKTPLKDYKHYLPENIKATPFGNLIETPDLSELNKDNFKVLSKLKPTTEQVEDAVFAWKVAKYIDTQAIVIAKDLKTNAVSHGLHSASIEFAMNYSCENSKDAILATDVPLTIQDLNTAAQGRIGLIIVPSASKEITALADKYSIVLIETGITNNLL